MSDFRLHDIPLTLIDGTETSFGAFLGKTVLVVNVASKCGFTPQYVGLEALYRRYADEGLVILGLPSNQFKAQEPGTESDIAAFCELNYGVTFPLTAKVDVNGENQHPLYAALTAFTTDALPGPVMWNFEKFLVNADGEIVNRFASAIEPESAEIVQAIEEVLVSARVA